MPLTTESPRFSLRTARLEDINDAISTIGHAVIDDAWNVTFLEEMRRLAQAKYEADDLRFRDRVCDLPRSETQGYLGGSDRFQSLVGPNGEDSSAWFFTELERSGIPALLRKLFAGDFVVGHNEHVIRRYDPTTMPLCFVMLHHDYQFGVCADEGLNSKRAVTIWTPFQACIDDSISRLVFLHRGEDYEDLFTEEEMRSANLDSFVTGTSPDFLARESSKVDPFFQRIYDSRRCYVPYVPLASSLIFDHTTVHGTFRLPGMERPRYSMDFRSVSKYRRTRANSFVQGVLYRNAPYPPMTAVEHLRRPWRSPLVRAALKPLLGPIVGKVREIRRDIGRA